MGLITREQVLAAGLTKRHIDTLIKRGEWVALYPGVYKHSSSGSSWRQSVLAAVYRGGPGAVASGRCAAALLSLPGFRPGKIDVTTPRNLRNPPFDAHRGTIPTEHVTWIGPIPLTDATRTLLDVASLVDQEVLEDALDDALRRSLTSLPRLKWLLRAFAGKGRRGSGALRELVQQRCDDQPIPESVLETRLWKPLAHLGVPRPIKQHQVEWHGERYRIDFAFPHAMVAVEAQSQRWHSSRQSLVRDARKNNALVALGWSVIYLTWEDVEDKRESTMRGLRDILQPRFL